MRSILTCLAVGVTLMSLTVSVGDVAAHPYFVWIAAMLWGFRELCISR